ncbi:MAG: MBL fold metallo-hydrolase [Candidatus Nanopelagicales bacterium]
MEPRLNDHSAFDAYSMLVEVDGKQLFYSGDIRGHGRKARLFEELLEDPPGDVEVLVMEGTHVTADEHPSTSSRSCASEVEVEDRLVQTCRDTTGLVVVCGSAQNLDRIVSVHRAALRSGRSTVVDLYGATVATAAATSIPQPGHRGLRVYLPNRQRVLVKQAREFHRVTGLGAVRVFPEELTADPGRFLLHVPSSTVAELLRAGALDRAGSVVWSLWDGYLRESSGVRLADSLREAGIPMKSIHTSGHATIEDLGRLASAFSGAVVVPIHSAEPEAYATMFPRVQDHADGEWWDV